MASRLLRLYARFNDIDNAVLVFNALREPDTVLWNLIIKSHVDSGLFVSAFLLYKKMREVGVQHDGFTFPIVNKAILSLRGDVKHATMIHSVAVKMGFEVDVYFNNTMIEAYAKCGAACYACKLFDEMSLRDLVSWTSMILVYICEGNIVCAFDLLSKMRSELEPNSVTMMVMLQACHATESFVEGRQFHCYVLKNGLLMDWSLQNSILGLYTTLGNSNESEVFFSELDGKNVVSWNILMSSLSYKGNVVKVSNKFNEMLCANSLSIETLTTVISAFAKSGNISEGEMLHCVGLKSGLCDDILLTSLLDFYAKFGKLGNSAKLFQEISRRNNISWSAMMSGFIQNGHFNEAIEFFYKIRVEGMKLSAEILKNLVDACAHLGALQFGKGIHGYLIRNYVIEECDVHLQTSLLNLYIKCGSISSARLCFNFMSIKDVVAWTSMIEGHGTHGQGLEALKLFHLMVKEGITPNAVTFLSLFSACSHSGLVSEGCELFNSMKWRFFVRPDLEHYTCIVDLLGRSAKLKEALAIIMRMVDFPDSRIWGALLGASRVHGDKRLGEYAAKKLLELEPDNIGYYTVLSNTQASVGQWHEVEEVRRVINEKDPKKKPGWSCIEVKSRIHGFVSGDRSHNQGKEIYELLSHLNANLHGVIT